MRCRTAEIGAEGCYLALGKVRRLAGGEIVRDDNVCVFDFIGVAALLGSTRQRHEKALLDVHEVGNALAEEGILELAEGIDDLAKGSDNGVFGGVSVKLD